MLLIAILVGIDIDMVGKYGADLERCSGMFGEMIERLFFGRDVFARCLGGGKGNMKRDVSPNIGVTIAPICPGTG